MKIFLEPAEDSRVGLRFSADYVGFAVAAVPAVSLHSGTIKVSPFGSRRTTETYLSHYYLL
jgi:hypothetical protein